MYELQKYRGWQYNERMPALLFFHMYQLLLTDSHKNELDPFQTKFLGRPTTNV